LIGDRFNWIQSESEGKAEREADFGSQSTGTASVSSTIRTNLSDDSASGRLYMYQQTVLPGPNHPQHLDSALLAFLVLSQILILLASFSI
jgi:hypothetical protein